MGLGAWGTEGGQGAEDDSGPLSLSAPPPPAFCKHPSLMDLLGPDGDDVRSEAKTADHLLLKTEFLPGPDPQVGGGTQEPGSSHDTLGLSVIIHKTGTMTPALVQLIRDGLCTNGETVLSLIIDVIKRPPLGNFLTSLGLRSPSEAQRPSVC